MSVASFRVNGRNKAFMLLLPMRKQTTMEKTMEVFIKLVKSARISSPESPFSKSLHKSIHPLHEFSGRIHISPLSPYAV